MVLVGPGCDSADIMYEKAGCWLARDLKSGDRVRLHVTGAHVATCCSIGFNGLEPLDKHYI